jgi:hypothetical protein
MCLRPMALRTLGGEPCRVVASVAFVERRGAEWRPLNWRRWDGRTPEGFTLLDPDRAWRIAAEVPDVRELQARAGHRFPTPPEEPAATLIIAGRIGYAPPSAADEWVRRLVGVMGHDAEDSVSQDWAHTLVTYQTELLTRGEAAQLAWWLESRFGP